MFTLKDDSVRTTIVVGATEVAFDMTPGRQYRWTANTDCYVRVTSAGGTPATVGSGSTLCMSGQQLLVGALSTAKTRISVIRDTVDGVGTLTEVVNLPNNQ